MLYAQCLQDAGVSCDSHRTHKAIWINKSSVNPKSTSNQSSKPCTVLQYPSWKGVRCDSNSDVYICVILTSHMYMYHHVYIVYMFIVYVRTYIWCMCERAHCIYMCVFVYFTCIRINDVGICTQATRIFLRNRCWGKSPHKLHAMRSRIFRCVAVCCSIV